MTLNGRGLQSIQDCLYQTPWVEDITKRKVMVQRRESEEKTFNKRLLQLVIGGYEKKKNYKWPQNSQARSMPSNWKGSPREK